jgi:hypothetical protein
MVCWARGAVPALVVLLLGAGCGGGGDDTSTGSSTTSTSVSIGGAVTVAQRTLPIVLPDSKVQDLVRDLCAATGGPRDTIVAEVRALPTTGPDNLAATITAIGKGAELSCPKGVATAPNLLHEVFDAATLAAGTSTSTAPSSTAPSSSSSAPTTTGAARVATVTATAPCSPVGTTGVTSTGYPMTCSSQSCAGDPYDQPRWRATNC